MMTDGRNPWNSLPSFFFPFSSFFSFSPPFPPAYPPIPPPKSLGVESCAEAPITLSDSDDPLISNFPHLKVKDQSQQVS